MDLEQRKAIMAHTIAAVLAEQELPALEAARLAGIRLGLAVAAGDCEEAAGRSDKRAAEAWTRGNVGTARGNEIDARTLRAQAARIRALDPAEVARREGGSG